MNPKEEVSSKCFALSPGFLSDPQLVTTAKLVIPDTPMQTVNRNVRLSALI